MLGGVATPSLASEQPILATFHRKPDLRDRTGRKQVGVEPGRREGGTGHLKGGRGGVGGSELGKQRVLTVRVQCWPQPKGTRGLKMASSA